MIGLRTYGNESFLVYGGEIFIVRFLEICEPVFGFDYSSSTFSFNGVQGLDLLTTTSRTFSIEKCFYFFFEVSK